MTQAGTFSEFVRTAEDIRGLRGKLEKVRRLADFLSSMPEEDLPLAVAFFSGLSRSSGRPLTVGFAAIEAAGRAVTGASEASGSAARCCPTTRSRCATRRRASS